jgi:hypothetical protein
MKSFLGMSTVIFGFAAAAIAACGSDSSDKNAKSPATSSQAMNELTPSERQEAEKRAAKDAEKERLAASREVQTKEVSRTSNALAVSSVATARCDRELKCKNIGANKTYLSTDECITKLQNDKRTDLNAQECPGGVSDKELTSCLKAIREEDCGNPLDSISRLTACRAGALCLK